MENGWYYSPISLRLVSNSNNNGSISLSGLHLFAKKNGKITRDFTLTLNYLPIEKLKSYSILANSNFFNNNESTNWFPCSFEYSIPLITKNNYLHQTFEFFKSNGFRLIPNDLENNDYLSMSIFAIKLKGNIMLDLIGLENYKKIEFCSATKGDRITIRSFPFNFTNSLLFGDFVSCGTICYHFNEHGRIIGYLSDVNYLENMIGGIVNKDDGSIGLVLGSLKKVNGDGELLVILSWEMLLRIIGLKKYLKKNIISPNKFDSLTIFDSVLPIVVNDKFSSSWGSCVYFTDSVLITNDHVVKSIMENPNSAQGSIFLSSNNVITLTQDDTLITPFAGLDLTFIELSKANILNFQKSRRPVTFCQKYKKGDSVRSVGFGLFFNGDTIPLESQGIISTIFSLPFFSDSNIESPSLIVTSASCWNGSSGGGIFDKAGNFVGLVTSNAQVKNPVFSKGQPEKTEKLTKFTLCLPIEIIKKCYEIMRDEPNDNQLNSKIKSLWSLDAYHIDLIVDRPKL